MQQSKVNLSQWYLLYTNPRAEKKVALGLEARGFEVFLPLHKTLKQWSDRKKWVEEPLFKSYVFIFTQLEANFFEILNTPGVVSFVNFGKKTAVVDSREIQMVKLMIGNEMEFEVVQNSEFQLGELIEVIAGPLIGCKGKIVNRKGQSIVLIELYTINHSVLINIPKSNIRSVGLLTNDFQFNPSFDQK